MICDKSPKRGEVWFVEFPIEDDNSRFTNRPVIVLADKDEEFEVLSVKVTKHDQRDEWDYPILYWSEAGLRLKSTARISKAMYLSSDNFIFKIGDLHKEDLSEVDKMFIEYINLQ